MKKILRNYPWRHCLLAGLLVVTFFLVRHDGVMASGVTGPEQCCVCHRKVCDATADKRYVHAPVRDKQCAVCHIVQSGTDRISIAKDGENQVQWLAGNFPRQDTEYWFSIPSALAGKKLIVQAEGLGGKMLRTEVQVPNLSEAEQLVVVSRPPEISELRVEEVKQGVFLTARITWKTERVTDSTVLYGENDSARKSIVYPWLTKHHEVLLTDLLPRRTYSFVAASQDIFGNKTVSSPLTISTHAFFSRPGVEKVKTKERVTVSGKYFRADTRFFVKFAANQPISMKIGTVDGLTVSTKESGGRTGRIPPEHLPLTDSHFLNTVVCYSCHPQTKEVLSHPVDVHPKRGMVIDSREFKILGDGRLTCMTCHVPHASDTEARIVRSDKKKLCLGCHKNFG
ncbi:MAG: cytochrome c3 family protein [Pseudomonadota bacterium]